MGQRPLSPVGRFLDITDEDFRHTFDWCVTSAFIMSQLAAPHMLSAGHGSIINISSGSARFGIRALSAYCVAKGGLEALTRAMAQEPRRRFASTPSHLARLPPTVCRAAWI